MAPTLTPEAEGYLKRVRECFEQAEPLHQRHRERWNHHYSLWRGYSDWKNSLKVDQRDRDVGLRGEKREWGAMLHIPIVFGLIETILPRMVSHRPRMLILPWDDVAQENVANMKWLIDHQQSHPRNPYEMVLQTVGKDGLLYGLGVQKLRWRKEVRKNDRYLRPSIRDSSKFVPDTRESVLFDDPWAEAVDPFDFIWDPYATSIETCRWVIHRVWLSTEQVLRRFQNEQWGGEQPDGTLLPVLTEEEIRGSGSGDKYDDVWQDRMKAAGHTNFKSRGEQLHEVWEYHTGDQVVVVLDRQYPVACGENPAWHGQIPFQVYRPTEDTHQFVGVGEPEVQEDLAEEMNTLRSQRRDAATMALNAPLAYYDGLVDPADIKWGPNQAIPVNGDPRELLHQFQVRDVPGSSYQEENALKSDTQWASGISESVVGSDASGGVSATATGAQLLQGNADTRIKLKTTRLETEVIGRSAYQWLRLNQQKIIEREVPFPEPPDPRQPGEVVWRMRKLTPNELAGTFLCLPAGGATAPANIPQDRSDAQALLNNFKDNPHVDQRWLMRTALDKMGVKQPDAALTPPEPGVPPAVLEAFKANLPAALFEAILEQAQREDAMAAQDASAQAQGAQAPMNGGPPEAAVPVA